MPKSENGFEFFDEIDSSSLSSRSSENLDANRTDDTSKQPAEFVYKLGWTTRDEIILSLNRYTRLLYGEKNETSEMLMCENTDLYQALISLPLKSSSNAPAGSGSSSKVVLDLNSITRLQIIRTLIANQSLIVDGDSASEKSNMHLVEKNGELIAKLAKLPVSVTTGSTSESVPDGKCIESGRIFLASKTASNDLVKV